MDRPGGHYAKWNKPTQEDILIAAYPIQSHWLRRQVEKKYAMPSFSFANPPTNAVISSSQEFYMRVEALFYSLLITNT